MGFFYPEKKNGHFQNMAELKTDIVVASYKQLASSSLI